MERYDKMDLDLECEGGGVAQKASLFGGMFKRSSRSIEPSVQQDSLPVNSELSKSNDSLTDNNNTKDKGGMFKGILNKTTKPAKEGTSAQDSLSVNSELSKSNDSLTDNNNTKDKGGMFKGILKKTTKPAKEGTSAQATLSVHNPELSASSDSLPDNNNAAKEKTGVLGGILRRSPKPGHDRRSSQDNLSVDGDLASSTDNLSENSNTKETGGIFSGMFKKSPKPLGARTQSQDDLSASTELSGSNDNLSENSNTKEKGGFLSGVFRKPKQLGAKSQSQDDLSVDSELSGSSDNLSEKTSKGGVMGKILKNPFHSLAQDKEKSEDATVSHEKISSTEKTKAKQNDSSGNMKSTFYTDGQEKSSDEEMFNNGERPSGHKQYQNKLAGAMTKLNPFRSGNKHEKQTGSDDEDPPASIERTSGHKQKETEETETPKENEKQGEEKPKPVKSNMIQCERKERSETPAVPPRPTDEELKGTATQAKLKPSGTEDTQENKKMIPRERKGKSAETPVVPARPTEEELNRTVRGGPQKQKKENQLSQSQSDDEGLRGESVSTEAREGEEANPTTKVKKPKRHNPFMPRTAAKAASDDEELKEESSSKEEKKEEDKDKETKVRKPKKNNPFLPRIKAKAVQKNQQDGAAGSNTAENEGGQRSLFDQLEDFRVNPAEPEDDMDVEGLMDWWNTVESWEDTPQDDDMTEKEEAKAFAVTAEKVQKGIRVFNKLFSERAESLWQHVIDLNAIADGLDKFNKNTKIAQITGGSTSAIGGVATIAGLALAPVTMGTSLIVTAVGLGVATAGGLTSAGAGISNQVNNSMDRKKVEKIVEDYQEKMADLNKCMMFIKQGIENLRKFDLIKMKKHAYNRDFPALNNIYEDGAMVGKAILINANEIMRVVQIANVAGSTAARAVQIASMATGVLTGLFVGMDIYFVAKDSKELKKGAKSEFAAKIREVAGQLHEGLVELNGIREELQSTSPQENNSSDNTATSDNANKEKDENSDSSEDEIDRIKKAIKKDYENREYV
ncbi:apolipoprotein L1 isoform X2 [Myripristis murdjan]|uniref:apolipoprotein L1 isoform X2 n=1 Tax=Myripristis murdjan TaxID=586833 RepID=UPI001175FA3D|nr:ribosome-binding protein 1-like isoform X2 [Myripristis murdjan]